jgi:hypothetical protein
MFTNLRELPEGILMLAQQMDKDVRTLDDRLSVDQGSNNVLDSNYFSETLGSCNKTHHQELKLSTWKIIT